jgi:transposase
LPNGYSAKYENNQEGLEALRVWIQSNSIQFIIFEPSGSYERGLRTVLKNHNIGFSLINAVQIRHFAKAKGLLAKTDKIDSMVLAEYGFKLQPKPFLDASQKAYELQEWLIARRKVTESI